LATYLRPVRQKRNDISCLARRKDKIWPEIFIDCANQGPGPRIVQRAGNSHFSRIAQDESGSIEPMCEACGKARHEAGRSAYHILRNIPLFFLSGEEAQL
jgi:hypothetical protein